MDMEEPNIYIQSNTRFQCTESRPDDSAFSKVMMDLHKVSADEETDGNTLTHSIVVDKNRKPSWMRTIKFKVGKTF